jgi:two-component system, LytTR family, sensor histidine kinase AlgZ
VTVDGRLEGDEVVIVIANPVSETARAVRSGNRMALDNIRQRLELAFPGRASVEVTDGEGLYRVTLRFPAVLEPASAAGGRW